MQFFQNTARNIQQIGADANSLLTGFAKIKKDEEDKKNLATFLAEIVPLIEPGGSAFADLGIGGAAPGPAMGSPAPAPLPHSRQGAPAAPAGSGIPDWNDPPAAPAPGVGLGQGGRAAPLPDTPPFPEVMGGEMTGSALEDLFTQPGRGRGRGGAPMGRQLTPSLYTDLAGVAAKYPGEGTNLVLKDILSIMGAADKDAARKDQIITREDLRAALEEQRQGGREKIEGMRQDGRLELEGVRQGGRLDLAKIRERTAMRLRAARESAKGKTLQEMAEFTQDLLLKNASDLEKLKNDVPTPADPMMAAFDEGYKQSMRTHRAAVAELEREQRQLRTGLFQALRSGAQPPPKPGVPRPAGGSEPPYIPAGAGGPPAAQARPGAGALPRVRTIDDYYALPPGADYIDPNGLHKKKGKP